MFPCHYLHQEDIIFMTVCLSLLFVAGLREYYWLELNEKHQKMGLGPT